MFISKSIPNKTAGYYRLSREDGDKMERDSIEVHFRFEDEMNDFLEHYGWQKAKRPELEALSE